MRGLLYVNFVCVKLLYVKFFVLVRICFEGILLIDIPPKHFGSSGTSYFLWLFFFLAFTASTSLAVCLHFRMIASLSALHLYFTGFMFMSTFFVYITSVALWERMRAIRIWRRPDESPVIGLGILGNWVLRSTTHSALQSTILGFLYLEDSLNPCLQAFGQTCAGFYIVTLRFRIVETPSLASERELSFHIED